MAGRPRPAAPTRPALALISVGFGLFGIARTTGSGWLIVIIAGVLAVVVLAAVLPVVGFGRVTVALEAPRDATVGRPFELTVELGGRPRPVKLRPLGLDADWTGALVPCRGRLAATAVSRGVVAELTVELRSASPLGLLWWRRSVAVQLARPIEVGPRPIDGPLRRPTGGSAEATPVAGVTAAAGDAMKATREYLAGDPIKLVHWPATARAGELMVKELESPGAPVVVIAVDLEGGGTDAVEAAASGAAGLAVAALRGALPVVMLTAEAAGPISGRVTSPVEVGRRLARAVPGRLPAPPPGTEPVLVSAADPGWRSGR